jgi:hypothetical protein
LKRKKRREKEDMKESIPGGNFELLKLIITFFKKLVEASGIQIL